VKILITGGAGFIGSTLSDLLLEEGNSVLILDNYQTGKKENNILHPKLKIIEGSISNFSLVNMVFLDFKPDYVVHAAASYKDPTNWTEDLETNIQGTINVINCSRNLNIKKFIYLQTSLCYGLKPLENPISLSHPLFNGEFSGGSSYAISKTAAEQYIALSGLNFLSFRLANVYGPRNASGPIPTFYSRMQNNLSCKIVNSSRDFIFVKDVVNIIYKGLILNETKGYYHIATGKNIKISEVYNLICKHFHTNKIKLGEEVEPGIDDVASIALDPSKTIKDFNWSVTTGFEEGLEITLKWYAENKIQKTFTHLKNLE
jgi:UDP-glucose 4-epimerase